MKCYICKRTIKTLDTLFHHLRYTHGIRDGSTQITCGQGACCATFFWLNGYRKHLKKSHADALCQTDDFRNRQDEEERNQEQEDDQIAAHDADEVMPEEADINIDEESEILSRQDIEHHAFGFVANLSERPTVPEVLINSVVNSADNLIGDIVSSASAAVSAAFAEHGLDDSPALEDIQAHLETLRSPFEEFSTSYRRIRYCSNMGMVEPLEISIGVRHETRRSRAAEYIVDVPVSETFTYIPILKNLELLLKHPEVLSYVKQSHISNDGVIRDFCDGQLYKETDLFREDPNALQLQFFYDDFVTVNPLGSKTIHKLGAFYYILKNLPPKFNSSLNSIHLAAICYTEDLKKYGHGKILQRIVEDINKLSTEGISLPDGGTKKGTLIQFSADNLGANSLFGFVESFSASYYCRLCLTSKEEAQEVFNESNCVMRSKDVYDTHVQQAGDEARHVYGVKNTCVLNELMYFHVLSNFSLDIMHDVLEGVLQYELKLVLDYFIFKSTPPLMSLNELNLHLSCHDYGMEVKNKPSYIKLDSAGNGLGQKAMQAWCLIRHIPFIIAHKIDEDNPHWELILKLLDCMDIIFSHQVTPGLIAQLSILIKDHHLHFRKIFPDKRLLPKHHFMLHYPTCLRKIGPLIHVWCMRFEAKHEYFGRVADAVRNYKNICKSLAKKHQVMQLYHLLSNQRLDSLEIGPGKETEIISLTNNCIPVVMEKIPQCNFSTMVYDANWVQMCGTKYQSSKFLCYDFDELFPKFGRIRHVLVHENNVYFALEVWETLSYSRHFHAFVIREKYPAIHYVSKTQSELVDYQPLQLLTDISEDNQQMYMSPKYVLFK